MFLVVHFKGIQPLLIEIIKMQNNNRSSSMNSYLQTDVNQPPHQSYRNVVDSPAELTLRPNISPYGMKFGEENQVKQREMGKYKEDLDYLVSLRSKYGEMSPKEWEEYNRKLNYMNDRYVYGEIDRKNFMKGMNKGYEDEIRYRKDQERLKKQIEAENERKKFEGYHQLEQLEREQVQGQKNKLHNEQLIDLENYYQKKKLDNKKKTEEELANLKLIDEKERLEAEKSHQFKNKINDLNSKIYGKVYNFNKYVNEPINNEAFTAKNDLEFNKRIADQRAKERNSNRNHKSDIDKRLQDMEYQKTIDQQFQKEKNENQKLYRDYLDNQNKMNQLNKLNETKNFGPQLLMPAYLYPNRPIPVNKKAKDSLIFSKEPQNIFDRDMNRFFHWDAQFNTMMDYDNKGKYLGDSMLRHNPITCPVNDYYYNRYVNQLKKNSEYLASDNNVNNILKTSGERIIK